MNSEDEREKSAKRNPSDAPLQAVDVLETSEDLMHDVCDFRLREITKQVGQRTAFKIFHHNPKLFRLTIAIDVTHNIWMLHGRMSAGSAAQRKREPCLF
jgi:hypothetical protein